MIGPGDSVELLRALPVLQGFGGVLAAGTRGDVVSAPQLVETMVAVRFPGFGLPIFVDRKRLAKARP